MTNSVSPLSTSASKIAPRYINSLFFAASFTYKNAFFLDVTGRNDWSSALVYMDGSGTPSYFYPSVSGAWEFTESFKSSMPSWLTYGKVRASFAQVGKDMTPWTNNEGYLAENNNWNGANGEPR